MTDKKISDYDAVIDRDFSTLWARHRRAVYHWANLATHVTHLETEDLVAEGMVLFLSEMERFNPLRCTNPETFNFSHQVYNPLKELARSLSSKRALGVKIVELRPDCDSGGSQEEISCLMDLVPHKHEAYQAHSPVRASLDAIEALQLEQLALEFSPPRQRLLQLLREGKTQRQMAFDLNVSTMTIRLEIAKLKKEICRSFGLEFHPVRGFALEGA